MRYMEPSGEMPEYEATLRRDPSGWSFSAQTARGSTLLTLAAQYDNRDQLVNAEVQLMTGPQGQTARVEVRNGKALVQRQGKLAQEFAVARGVIVTSAPDWSDIRRLCRRCDRKKAGKQEFQALWVHPTEAAQLLTFSIERLGADMIKLDKKVIELDRFLVRIRNNQPYAAWADSRGRLIRLLPLPAPERAAGIVLEGFDEAVEPLRPPDVSRAKK